jgi:acyl transferase domain-containing protein
VSALDGRTVIGFELDARYWARSLSRPAPDAASIAQALVGEDGATLVELSPDLRVSGSGASLAGVAGAASRDALLEALAALHVRGTRMDLRALHPWGGRCVDLPGYRFDRQRYWRAADLTRSAAAQPAAACPVLGERLDTAAVRSVHQNVLSLGARAVLGDHVVYGKAVVAGAHYVTAMLAAAASELGDACVSLTDVELSRSLAIEPGESFALQTIARDESGELAMSVASRPHGRANSSAAWTAHCRATASRAGELAERPDLSSASARCLERFEKEAFYREWKQAGYQLGPAFSAIDRLARRDGEVLAELSNPERGRAEQSPLACGLLDSLFQMIAVACPGGDDPPHRDLAGEGARTAARACHAHR